VHGPRAFSGEVGIELSPQRGHRQRAQSISIHKNPYLRERAAAPKERRATNNEFSSDARQDARRNGNSPKRNVVRSLFRFIFQTNYSPRQ
jgi:hypothetical protein